MSESIISKISVHVNPTVSFGFAPKNSYSIQGFNQNGEEAPQGVLRPGQAKWDDIAKRWFDISKLKVIRKKGASPGMVWASFKEIIEGVPFGSNNGKIPLVRRLKKNIEKVSCLTIDLDDSPLDWQDILDTLESLNICYAFHTTHSYDPWTPGKDRKFRIVVPFDKGINIKYLPACVLGFINILGLEISDIDLVSLVGVQIMYLPATKPGFEDDHSIALGTLAEGKGFCSGKVLFDLGKKVEAETPEGENVLDRMSQNAGGNPLLKLQPEDVHEERHNYLKGCYARDRKYNRLPIDVAREELLKRNSRLPEPLEGEELNAMVSGMENSLSGEALSYIDLSNLGAEIANYSTAIRESKFVDWESEVIKSITEGVLKKSELAGLFGGLPQRSKCGRTARGFKDRVNELVRISRNSLGNGGAGAGDEDTEDEFDDPESRPNRSDAELIRHFKDSVKSRLDRYVWVSSLNKVLQDNGIPLSMEAFDSILEKLRGDIFKKYNGGEREVILGAMSGTFKKFIFGSDLITVVDSVGMKPGAPLIYEDESPNGSTISLLNQYSPPEFAELEFDEFEDDDILGEGVIDEDGPEYDINRVQPILDHIQYLIPDDKDRNLVLGLFAHLVKNPSVRVSYMVILTGPEGNGKSLLFSRVLGALVGPHNIGVVTNDSLVSGYNSCLFSRHIGLNSEVYIANTKEGTDALNEIKTSITDTFVMSNEKYGQKKEIKNYSTQLATSNYTVPVPVKEGNRRYLIIRTAQMVHKGGDSYYEKLLAWLKPEFDIEDSEEEREIKQWEVDQNIAHLRRYFELYDNSDFSPDFMKINEHTLELQQALQSWESQLMEEFSNLVKQVECPIDGNSGVYLLQDLLDVLQVVVEERLPWFLKKHINVAGRVGVPTKHTIMLKSVMEKKGWVFEKKLHGKENNRRVCLPTMVFKDQKSQEVFHELSQEERMDEVENSAELLKSIRALCFSDTEESNI